MKAWLALVLLVTALAGCAAPPDDVEQLSASGVFSSGARLSGTMSLDETTGQVLALHFTVTGARLLAFVRLSRQYSTGYAYVVAALPADVDCPRLVIGERDQPSSLRGYAGGALGPHTMLSLCNGSQDGLLQGTLAPGS